MEKVWKLTEEQEKEWVKKFVELAKPHLETLKEAYESLERLIKKIENEQN